MAEHEHPPDHEPDWQASDDEAGPASGGPESGGPGSDEPARQRAKPFSPVALARSLWLDAAIRYTVFAAVVLGLGGVFAYEATYQHSASLTTLIAALLAVGGWVGISAINAKASRQLPQISMLIEADPAAAEERIVENLRRRPLLRWVRLMLYHRLAVVRHRQQRYEEASAICGAVLGYPLGPARATRPHLLLMLAEARIESGDPVGAYQALAELHQNRLSLTEALQRMALQTRYEVMLGQDAAALRGVDRKVQMAELMPAGQCGALHALLAIAAQRQEREPLAAWLWARVDLLCEPEQVRQMRGESLKSES